MTNGEYADVLSAARKRNAGLDAIDGTLGLPPLAMRDEAEIIRTALFALEAGIRTADWECVAEAAAMLHDRRQRGAK